MKNGKIGTKKIGKNRIVVGIDQSYADSGIAVVYNGRLMAVTDCKPKSTDDHTAVRKQLRGQLRKIFGRMQIKQQAKEDCELVCIIERIRLQSAKPGEQHFLNLSYIKGIGALNALIVDTASEFGIPVYSVDTRSWKSQVIGSSKPGCNKFGFPNEKWPTIAWCIGKGYGKWIAEEVSPKKKKGVVVKGDKRFTYNDNKADAIGIAMYGFVREPKLEEEH